LIESTYKCHAFFKFGDMIFRDLKIINHFSKKK
jgi:hypothetical protein